MIPVPAISLRSTLKTALLASFILVAYPLQAQAPVARTPDDTILISLNDAVRTVLGRSQEAQLARSEMGIADQQVRAARSAALPTLSGVINYTRTYETPFRGGGFTLPDSLRFEPDSNAALADRVSYLERNAGNAGLAGFGSLFSNLPFGQLNSYVATLNVSQTLYAAGKVGAALRIAEAFKGATQAGVTEQLAELEFRTRTAYVSAQLSQELELIATVAVEQADNFLAQERLRFESGVASELDVLRAEVSAENLRPDLVRARNASAVATLDLKALLDIPPATPLRLSTALDVQTAERRVSDAARRADALDDRPALKAAERTVAIRREQLRIARAGHLPTVSLRANYGRQAFTQTVFGFNGVDWRNDFNAVVGVQIPIFSGFRVDAEAEQATVALAQEELRLTQLREGVALQYERAVGERERAEASLAARERTVAQATRVHDLTVLRYEQGLATQLEVADARLGLLRARTALAQATADYHLAAAAIVRALGETTVSF